MATKQSMEVINSIGQALELPFIVSTGPRSHLLKNSFSIIMTPSYIPAIVDYIIFNEWKIVYYMYDSEDGQLIHVFRPMIRPYDVILAILVKTTFKSLQSWSIILKGLIKHKKCNSNQMCNFQKKISISNFSL